MKALKIALICILGLVTFLVVAVAILWLPAVQRSLVTRFAASGPGEAMEADYLHVGFSKTKARNLNYTTPDTRVVVTDLTADLSLFDLIFRRQARFGDMTITGLVIDLSDFEPEEDPEPFEGILRQMELPMPVHIGNARVEGRVIFPGAGEAERGADFVLTGGGLAPGSEGEFNLRGQLDAPRPGAFAALEVDGDVILHQGNGGQIERARLLAMISSGAAEPDPEERLSADVLLLVTDEGESYQARVGPVLTSQGEEEMPTFIVLDATYRHDKGLMEGRWELDVDRERLAAFVAGTELPAFSASGSGQFSYGVAGETFEVEGEVDVAIADLAQIAAELEEIGGLSFNSRFNFAMDEKRIHLEELVVNLRDQQDRDLLEARNFQPVRYDRQAERVEGSEERLDLAEVTLRALPVEWINLFLQAAAAETKWVLRGGDAAGQLIVSAEGGGLFFRLAEPLRAGGISILADGEALLTEVSLEATGSGSFQDGRFEATMDPLRFFHGDDEFLSASGAFDSSAGSARAALQGNLPVLLSQPALAEYNNLSAGVFEARMSLNLNEAMEIEVEGSLRDLVTREEQQSLPALVFQGLLRESPEDQSWEIDFPVRIEGTNTSDVRVTGQISPGEQLNRFDLNLSGDRLMVEDAMALASAFAAPEAGAPAAESPAPAASERDEEPAWAGTGGVVKVNIAELQLQEGYGMENLRGELTVEGDSVAHSLRATFLDGPLEVDARLRFEATEERPYVLDGEIQAPELAADELFRQLQPNRPPTVEGIFAISVEIEGTGQNVPDLANRVRGQARLQSDGGILRLLYTENPVVGLGRAAGAILGTVRREVGAITAIADKLSEMPYEEMNLFAERDEDLNFNLRELVVLSPELHLRGVGEIRHREGVEILQQPMEVRLRLGALGSLEQMLATARVLGNQTDDLGYRQLRRDFTITGTPADPDASAFYRMLGETILQFVGSDGDEEDEGEESPRTPQVRDILDIFGGGRQR